MIIGDPQPPTADAGCRPVHYLFVAVMFAAAYGQAALYYSNQNQYFLHGFARADQGLLREDWLANTLDPTPIFSQLTAWTVTYLHPWAFHMYLAVLMGIYAAAMLDLFDFLVGPQIARRHWLTFAFLLVLIHSAALRWSLYHWLAPQLERDYQVDYPWYFQSGVAGQYLLGGMLQPSVVGVLLLAGLAFFLRDRLVLSSLCIAAAATMHNTYLLPGAMLTAGFLTQLAWERRQKAALLIGLLTLALVLPTVIHSLSTFGPTSLEQFAEAQDILANDRIPHHCRMDRWLDRIAVMQIVWVILSIALVWKTRLFVLLAVCLVLSSALSVAQYVTGSNLLALLFPWRISTVLVPVATTIVLSRLIGRSGRQRASPVSGRSEPADAQIGWRGSPPPYVGGSLLVGLLVLAGLGIGISVGRLAFQSAVEDEPLMDFVREHRKPGEVYLLPVTMLDRKKLPAPKILQKSSDFKPPPDKARDKLLIPLDLQQFRLHTEAPIFVDFKAIPYKDVEVIEWFTRLKQASDWQESFKKGEVPMAELRERRVTHLVRPAAEKKLANPGLILIYPTLADSDATYRIYELVK